MGAWFKRFWQDADYFTSLLRSMRTLLSGLLGALSLAVVGGQINLGEAGWWASPIGFLAAFLVHGRSASVEQQIKALSAEKRASLSKELSE